MTINPGNQVPLKRVGILFIGVSVYLRFFERFFESITKLFLPNVEKLFFVFTDNRLRALSPNVRRIHVSFNDPRYIKLHKFHFISGIIDQFDSLDHIFYFDADCTAKSTIDDETVQHWFSDSRALVGVLHPWQHIRKTEKRFEDDSKSTAFVHPAERGLLEYHQSCFWGGDREWISKMALSIKNMVEEDLLRGHINRHMICDEIYVNRYFMTHREVLRSLDTEYANPGVEYERVTASSTRAGYRFPACEIVVHDNAAQTGSWRHLNEAGTYFSHGAFAQFYKDDQAAYCALERYRQYNAKTPVVLLSDGGDDLSALAAKFNCIYRYETANIGTFRNRHSQTNQYDRMVRVREACNLLIEADWVVILEPDVECLSAPKAIPRYALCGPSQGPAWSPGLRALIEARHPGRSRQFGIGQNYTGCGGSIFNREAFIECFDKTPKETFELGANADARIMVAEDACMSFLFQINGYDTGGWEDFTGWKTEDKGPFAFAHGDKRYYGLDSPLKVPASDLPFRTESGPGQ